jgi:multiple sugar transport system permease protein
VLLALNIFPLIFTIIMSFSNASSVTGLGLTARTLDNWRQLLLDGSFWSAMKFTTIFVVVAVGLEYFFGFAMALLLWRKIPGGGFFRVLFSIPMMLAPVAIGFMFRLIYNEQYGPIDGVLIGLHLPPVPWLSGTTAAPIGVVIMDIWEWTPLLFLLLLAGLQAMPDDAIEAARLDGASGPRIIFNIIFPILLPISIMAVFLRMIDAFTIFGQIYSLTGGGPGNATTSTTLYAFQQGFLAFNVSYGAAISLALLIFVTVVAIVFLTIGRYLIRRLAV